ncbi:MAG TPA: hypothetical protein VL979_08290 [Solirubrobacteraceae bacterium]|nr:hypothetical protein [Solirubrobacteraceae bacterium]
MDTYIVTKTKQVMSSKDDNINATPVVGMLSVQASYIVESESAEAALKTVEETAGVGPYTVTQVQPAVVA